MPRLISRPSFRHFAVLAAALWLSAPASRAEEEKDIPWAPTVTVLKAKKACFNDIVEVSGIVMPREETAVRPERIGLKVAEVMADPGDTVTAGQTLARLNLPEGGFQMVQAPVAGVISSSSATIGALASGRGEALFNIIARSEYDLVGLVPTGDIGKLQVKQPASLKVIGAGDLDGTVRRIAPTVQPDVQLGQVFISVSGGKRLAINTSGRALIRTGQSCNVAVPLTAVQYNSAGTTVQVVRRQHVETHRVELGLMSGSQIEIRDGLSEGEDVVAIAGSILREGDPVRPVFAGAK
jgi:multidrug efflux pump subunit AcrA (membrane-fusion protein)